MPPQVSVAVGKKPKPKEGFKFLRRDEGRLSYSQQPVPASESPMKSSGAAAAATSPAAGEPAVRERRDSKSLREAIASDMRKAKSHDYLAEVVVAVPKKAPPPHTTTTRAASTAPPLDGRSPGTVSSKSTTPARPPQRPAASRPPWVDPDIPPPPRSGHGEWGVASPSQSRPLSSPRRERETGWAAAEDYNAPHGYRPASREGSAGNSRDGEAGATGRYGYDNYPSYNNTSGGGNVVGPRREAVGGRRYTDPAYGGDYDSYGTSHAVSLSAAEAQMVAAPVAAAVGGSSASLSQVPHTSYGGADNYFRPARGAPELGGARLPSRAREEEDLMLQLEREVAAAQKEREQYMTMKQEVDRERQSFTAYRFSAQREIEDARAELKETQAQLQREAQKDVKSISERYRSVSNLLSTERAANAKLMQENETLRTQLEELTTTMREMQLGHKTEAARMRRDIESLTRRNSELLAMAKEQQIRSLEGSAAGGGNVELLVSAVPEIRAVRAPSLAGRPRSNSSGGGGGGSVRPMISAHAGTSAPTATVLRASSAAPRRTSPEHETPATMEDAVRVAKSPSRTVVTAETGAEGGGNTVDDDAAIAAARERRARAVEAHLRREEEERQRRRQQREQALAERAQERSKEQQVAKSMAARGQHNGDDAAVAHVAATAEHDARRDAQAAGAATATTSLRKDKAVVAGATAPSTETQEAQDTSERAPLVGATGAVQADTAPTSERKTTAVCAAAAEVEDRASAKADVAANAAGDVAQERIAAGHPLITPRLTKSSTLSPASAAGKKLFMSVSRPPVVPRPRHIPTHDELVGDVEPVPTEELPNDAVVSQVTIGDNPNKREVLYRSGKRVIHYSNGTIKTILPSGHTVLRFTNKDVKCTYPSGRSTYWYEAAQTTHTQQPDDVQIFEFHATGQTERHFPDGTKEILYPDGSFKIVHPDGAEETFVPEKDEEETERV